MKLGHSDLVSFLMAIAIYGDGKLGHADLINSPVEGYPFGWTRNSTPSKGKVFPDLPGNQYITVQMNLNCMELKTKGIQ